MRFRTTALLLMTGSIGLGFAGTAFAACGTPGGTYGGYDPTPPESITVTAPRFQYGFYKLNVPPPTATMSQRVQFADLDLCTPAGRRELRARTIAAAHNVCTQLTQVYEHGLPSQPSCDRDALATAQPKVDFAIANARGER
jgi:UrcA family protein